MSRVVKLLRVRNGRRLFTQLIRHQRRKWSSMKHVKSVVANGNTCTRNSNNKTIITSNKKEEQTRKQQNNIFSSLQRWNSAKTIRDSIIGVTNNDDNNDKLDANNGSKLINPTSVTALCVASALVTTPAGYTMSPAMVTTLSNLPLGLFALMQVSGVSPIRTILAEKDTGDLNPNSFVMLYVNCVAWTYYGILINDFPIYLSNGVGVVAGLAYTLIFAKYAKNTNMLPYYLGSSAAIATCVTSPMWLGSTESAISFLGSFGMCAAIILMSSPLSSVRTVLANKNTDSMPFLVSFAMTLNGAGWAQYGILIKNDFFVYFPNGLGFLAGCAQLGLHAKYNKQSPFYSGNK